MVTPRSTGESNIEHRTPKRTEKNYRGEGREGDGDGGKDKKGKGKEGKR